MSSEGQQRFIFAAVVAFAHPCDLAFKELALKQIGLFIYRFRMDSLARFNGEKQ